MGKGRGRPPKLNPQQVAEIRLSEETLKDIAAKYSVSVLTIMKVKHGKPPYTV